MKKTKIETHGKDNATLIADLRVIVQKTTGNAALPGSGIAAGNLGKALTALETAGNDKKTKEDNFHNAVDAERNARSAVDAAVAQLRTAIDNDAQGNETKILSSGAKVSADAAPSGLPAQVTGLKAQPGNLQNTIRLDWDAQSGATFEIQVSDSGDPNGTWTHAAIATKSKATLAGIASGSRKWARVAAINSTGQGPWSAPATGIAS